MQDPVHVVVKMFRALMNKELIIGTGIASRSHLLSLIRHLGKVVTDLSEVQLTQNKDRMSYELARKVCHSKVINELKRPEEKATKVILELMHHIEIAFIEHDTKPEDRIYSAWYLAIFCRMWRSFIKVDMASKDNRSNVLNVTMLKNFLSQDLYTCLELNGHCILR